MGHVYIPHDDANQILATGLLKWGKPEKNASENLRYLGFPEANIHEKPLRMEKTSGAVPFHQAKLPLPNLGLENNNKTCGASDYTGSNQYLVIYEDCLDTRKLQNVYLKRQIQVYQALWNTICDKGKVSNRWILWHPRHFGDGSLKGHDNGFRKILDGTIVPHDAGSSGLIEEIRKRTIVFLRAEDLADAGIGQRGDGSVEECLEGILEEIEKNPGAMEILNGCAAVVIEEGVDSAFLLQLNKSGKVEHCQTFFRTSRTDNAYLQKEGYIKGIGDFMVTSCLNFLITHNPTDITDKTLISSLSAGIKDGLWRMLLKFNIGYPIPDTDEPDQTNDLFQKHFQRIYQLVSPEKILDAENNQLIDNVIKQILRVPTNEGGEKEEFSPYWAEIQKDRKNKILKIAKRYQVHNQSLGEVKSGRSAAFLSRLFRFPGTPFKFLRPWLLEQQWNDIRTGKDINFMSQDVFLAKIVTQGLENLEKNGTIKFPIARFGNLEIVEPDEISMYRRINNLMRKYLFDSTDLKPLGLAVFGAPGSGKGFCIEKIAEGISQDVHRIDCNMAQLKEPDDLYKTLLEVHNFNQETPETQIPILILDEFDSPFGEKQEPFGWCKHFLTILQDGQFRHDNHLYKIGKVIVVCAGGLCNSFREFESKSWELQYRDAKLPDFISRLQGYLDIAGPNPYFPYPLESDETRDNLETAFGCNDIGLKILGNRRDSDWSILCTLSAKKKPAKKKEKVKDKTKFKKDIEVLDPLYKIRRAVLLRSLLKRCMPSIYNEKDGTLAIGDRVLRALLNISEYKYGSRSMQAIIAMSVPIFRDSRRFTSAMLPPPEQLEMHVDAKEFYSYIYD